MQRCQILVPIVNKDVDGVRLEKFLSFTHVLTFMLMFRCCFKREKGECCVLCFEHVGSGCLYVENIRGQPESCWQIFTCVVFTEVVICAIVFHHEFGKTSSWHHLPTSSVPQFHFGLILSSSVISRIQYLTRYPSLNPLLSLSIQTVTGITFFTFPSKLS